MLKCDLGYYPYKLQTVQELKEINFSRWKDFCEQFLHLPLLEDGKFFSDEAHFELNGCVKNKTCTTGWLTIQIGRLLNHYILNGLQCVVSFHSTASTDLFFSKDKNKRTVKVNFVWYKEMSKTFFWN